MIANLMALSVRARWTVLALFLVIAGLGVWQLTKLPIDAVPDITTKQVQINTIDPRLSPVEIEKLVTYPVEIALAGIPGLETTRSISRNGFSQVSAIFTDSTDLYFARQQVGERLRQATQNLPEGVQPQVGPVSTGLGEIVMSTVGYANPDGKGAKKVAGQPGWQPDGSYLTPEGERLTDPVAKASYLRTVQDWIIGPQLRSVKGIAGVDSIGGYAKTFVVEPDPTKLASFGISYSELGQALENANLAVGANYYNKGGEAYLVRVDSRVRTVDEIRNAVAATRGGTPITIGQIANVRVGGDLRTGAGSMNGQEAVIGTVLMLIGQNSRVVAEQATAKLDQVEKTLPPGIEVTVAARQAVADVLAGMSRARGEDQSTAPDRVAVRPGGDGAFRRWRKGGVRCYLDGCLHGRVRLPYLVGDDEDEQRGGNGEDDTLGIAIITGRWRRWFGHLPAPKWLSGTLRNAVPHASGSGRRPPRMFTWSAASIRSGSGRVASRFSRVATNSASPMPLCTWMLSRRWSATVDRPKTSRPSLP